MEGYDISITLDDRDFAADFAAAIIATQIIPFHVSFHDGMMQWTFRFQDLHAAEVGEAMDDALKRRFS